MRENIAMKAFSNMAAEGRWKVLVAKIRYFNQSFIIWYKNLHQNSKMIFVKVCLVGWCHHRLRFQWGCRACTVYVCMEWLNTKWRPNVHKQMELKCRLTKWGPNKHFKGNLTGLKEKKYCDESFCQYGSRRKMKSSDSKNTIF